MGYDVIQFPYIIQPPKNILEFLFGDYTCIEIHDMSNGFECGFIHPGALSLGDFSLAGMVKAKNFIDILPQKEMDDVLKSMVNRSITNGVPVTVYNPYCGTI